MSGIMWRIRRLDEALDAFFESERWEMWTKWMFRISFVLFLLMAGANAETIIAVLSGQPS